MKNNYKKITFLFAALFIQNTVSAQCGVPANLGTATNMVGLIRNNSSAIAASKTLNTVAFIHRNNATAFGGNSGQLRFDFSANGGATWTTNLGVITPTNSNLSRYPNVAIYNPAANTNTANAYLSYMAPTISTVTSTFNGVATGVSKFNVTGVTENYNQNGIGTTNLPSSLVTGSTGIFWAIEPTLSTSGFNIYKGVWSSILNDVVWSTNFSCAPTFINFPTTVYADYTIGFDPTGTIGYFCFTGQVSPGPSDPTLYPILYKTTDGGNTWTGPITVDVTKFGCITSNIGSSNLASMNNGHDLVVDVNGNPHIITTLGGSSGYVFNYNLWHHMYDITVKNGLWVAYDLGNVNCGENTFGVTTLAPQDQAPQAARSADGTKIFFTWADNASASLGSPNSTPDLFGKAYNVTNNSWTPTKNFTSCNVNAAGKIIFPHIAAEVLEPNATTYLIPTIYGEPSVTNDLDQIANFKYLDNVTFAISDFSISVPPATVTIQQAPLVVVCPGSSLTINVVNGGQAIWNTGATTTSLSITASNATSYSVIAQVGCNVGTASVAVTNLTLNASSLSPSICPGNSASFTAVGNALGYSWLPGNMSGANVTLTPISNAVTLTAMGSSSCTTTQTVGIVIWPVPTISIAGNSTICAGSTLTQNASGAQSYLWSTGATGATFTDTPLTNTVYTVIGTDVNTCTNTQIVNVTVSPTPILGASSNPTAACVGQSVALIASGAATYSLNNVSSTANVTVAPAATTVYTITGAGLNLCTSTKTVSVLIYALPVLTVTPSRAHFCKGEKIILTASGAASYTWTSPGVLTPSAQVNPITSTTYSVIGASIESCLNTQTFALIVNDCLGIEQQLADNLHLLVYPNPSNGAFMVSGSIDITLNIVNELGQVMRTITLNESNAHEISIQDLSGGVYFLVGQKEGVLVNQKIVVTK